MQEFDWSDYYQFTKEQPPRPLLVRAVALLGHTGEALDLGCGAGRDTRYLVAQGFHVTAVDGSASAQALLVDIPDEHFDWLQSTFEDFSFAQYDLVNAHYALPFTHKQQFSIVFARLKASLRPGGLFVGQFFGVNDAWNTSQHASMTFLTREQALEQLEGLNIIEFTEEDREAPTADGAIKHWHAFHIIASQM